MGAAECFKPQSTAGRAGSQLQDSGFRGDLKAALRMTNTAYPSPRRRPEPRVKWADTRLAGFPTLNPESRILLYLPTTSRALPNTASSIGSVSRPVKVFCWLG